MIPEHFYITGLGLAVYVALYLPLSFALAKGANAVLKRFLKSSLQRRIGVGTFGLLLASAPMIEVYSVSLDAQRLCLDQAGLKIHRVVEASGYLGGIVENELFQHGYAYVEAEGEHGRKLRKTMKDGQVVQEAVDSYASRYLVRRGDNYRAIGSHFNRSSDEVVDRQTGEVLGELGVIRIYPSLIDNIGIALTGMGSGFSPWVCGNEPPPGRTTNLWLYDLIFATIHPLPATVGDQQ